MSFQPGNKLAVGGRKEKPWADALRVAVNVETPAGLKRLRVIAERCAEAAMDGDLQAMKEIGDRLDGKPMQESHHTITRTAVEMTDDELIRIAAGSGDDAPTAPIDPSQLN